MQSNTHYSPFSEPNDIQIQEYYENLISYIRSRLNIIGTSIYLLESNMVSVGSDSKKYIKKINDEIESIRKLLND